MKRVPTRRAASSRPSMGVGAGTLWREESACFSWLLASLQLLLFVSNLQPVPKEGEPAPPPSCCVCAQACLLQPWDQGRGASCREGGTTLARGRLSPPGLGPPLLVHCSCTRNTVALQACPTRHQCVSCCPADSWGTGAATPSTPDSAGVGLNCTGKCSPSAPPSEVGSGSTGSTGSAGHPAPQCWRTPHKAGIGENLFANGVQG